MPKLALSRGLTALLNDGEKGVIVDSILSLFVKSPERKPVEFVVKTLRKGFSKAYYKLHPVTLVWAMFVRMDTSKASVHDVHYLSDIKHSNLSSCTLIWDRGYLSKEHQLDLFSACNIQLTPKSSNQNGKEPFAPIFRKSRKRIETLFFQLCDQPMLKRNYVKSNMGVSVRILCKVTAVTVWQYINHLNSKPLNRLGYAIVA